jgi:membrane protease subunit HflK
MALNDPQWGKKGEGPPDLDEILRKFNQKLASLFGGGGPPSGKGSPSMKQWGGGLGLIIIIALFIWS